MIADDESVAANMAAIAEAINAMDADIVLLQEVDLESKRTGYLNQVQYLLDNTYLNYGSYASMWEADYIPSDGGAGRSGGCGAAGEGGWATEPYWNTGSFLLVSVLRSPLEQCCQSLSELGG